MCSGISNHIHSATYWKQEVIVPINEQIPPRRFITSISDVVMAYQRPWRYNILRSLTFCRTAWAWRAFHAMRNKAVSEGLGMLEQSPNLTHMSQRLKCAIWCGACARVWKNGSIAPPVHFRRSSLCSTFHPHVPNLLDRCVMSRLKKCLGAKT